LNVDFSFRVDDTSLPNKKKKKKEKKKNVDQRGFRNREEEEKRKKGSGVESRHEVDYEGEITEKETGLILRAPVM
jgi:hypothetical protein